MSLEISRDFIPGTYKLCNPCIEELDKNGLSSMNDGMPYVTLNEHCERCGKPSDRILSVILFERSI